VSKIILLSLDHTILTEKNTWRLMMEDHDHNDEVMRLTGCTHLEEMHDLYDFLLAKGSLDVDATQARQARGQSRS